MTCVICKQGELYPGTTTVTMTRGESTVVIKKVPADICENCGEYYLSEDISKQVMLMAEEAIKRNHEVEIVQFAA